MQENAISTESAATTTNLLNYNNFTIQELQVNLSQQTGRADVSGIKQVAVVR